MTKQDALSITKATLSSYNMKNGANNRIIRYGKMRTLIIDGTADKTFSANTSYPITPIAEADRPYDCNYLSVAYSRYHEPCYLIINNTSGNLELSLGSTVSEPTILIVVTYIARG